MTYVQDGNHYIVRILQNEDVFESLLQFADKEEITAASFTGIGAVRFAEFGYYSLTQKEYVFKTYDQMLEVVSLTGNLSQFNDKPALHIHAAFSNEENNVIGGHVNQLIVGVTLEIHLIHHHVDLVRQYDEAIGLNLFQLPLSNHA